MNINRTTLKNILIGFAVIVLSIIVVIALMPSTNIPRDSKGSLTSINISTIIAMPGDTIDISGTGFTTERGYYAVNIPSIDIIIVNVQTDGKTEFTFDENIQIHPNISPDTLYGEHSATLIKCTTIELFGAHTSCISPSDIYGSIPINYTISPPV